MNIRRSRPLFPALPAAALAVLLATPVLSAAAVRFAVSFPASLSKTPLDGRMLLLLSTDGRAEPRFQISDGAETQLVFGIDVDGRAPGSRGGHRRQRAFGYPRQEPRRHPARRIPRAGPAAPLRDLPRCRRPRRQAAHGPGRGPAVERRAREPLQHAPRRSPSIPVRRGNRHLVLDREIPPIPRAQRHEVHQARAHSERAADEVLGTADAPRGLPCSCPRASTSTPRRATRWSSSTAISRTPSRASAKRRPIPTSSPSTASASGSRATTAIQQEYAHAVLQGLDRARLPAGHRHGDPARQSRTTTTPTR